MSGQVVLNPKTPKPVSVWIPRVQIRRKSRKSTKDANRIRSMGVEGERAWREAKERRRAENKSAHDARCKLAQANGKRGKKLRRKALRKKNRALKKWNRNVHVVTTTSKSEYVDYLRSDHWTAVKRRIRAARKVCEACGLAIHLHVHHGTYDRKGRELDTDLFLLCENCHKEIHRRDGKKVTPMLMRITEEYIRERKGYLPHG